ncbi:MAG: RdgB/HAM1 family non-canonical purine NTP pyrophosphatase [Acidobacteria bacterium]|nr:RdgB/HAM1 family non-canonical purine NTP pyrophosphatase [Acidobacteriota bacterium]
MNNILYCATGNPGKLREFQLAAQIENRRVEIVPNLKDIPAPEETGTTFEENAMLKALYYSAFAPGPVFCDDSGLEVDALNGAPGVHSARYAGTHGDDQANNRLLLENLKGNPNRTARFVCAIALAEKGEPVLTVRGTVEGEIVADEPKGPHGFGYDPLFYYPPFGCTFGEADATRKHEVSHRANAFRLLLSRL